MQAEFSGSLLIEYDIAWRMQTLKGFKYEKKYLNQLYINVEST